MGLLSSLLGKDAKAINNPTNFQTLPDFGQDLARNVVQQGTNIANQAGYFNPIGFRQPTINALTALENGVQSGVGGFNFGQKANATYNGVANNLNAANGYLSQIPAFVNAADGRIEQGSSAITGQDIQGGINDFMNPYTDAVINNSVRDIQKYGEGLFSDMRSMLSDAGAAGSSRDAIYAAELGKGLMQQVGDTSSALRMTGYENAANRALQRLQTDKNNALAGAGLNLNQAGVVNNAANTQNSIASNMLNLGNSLTSARTAADAWRGNDVNAKVDNLNRQIGAGQMFTDQELAQRNVPMEQLNYLKSIYDSVVKPMMGGGTVTQKPGSTGLLGRIGGAGSMLTGGFKSFGLPAGATNIGAAMPWLG